MTRCPAASSGCNGPREGECMGLCHPIKFAGKEPEPEYDEIEPPLEAFTYMLIGAFITIIMGSILWYFWIVY